eukprot:GHVQ01001635.1.p2 GENE.GHVQ01001635.1~~GHVQ01001635.1.p2  ORF type:complete len:150 (+),score=23.14 GHVQ01001635.1:107-556(+)
MVLDGGSSSSVLMEQQEFRKDGIVSVDDVLTRACVRQTGLLVFSGVSVVLVTAKFVCLPGCSCLPETAIDLLGYRVSGVSWLRIFLTSVVGDFGNCFLHGYGWFQHFDIEYVAVAYIDTRHSLLSLGGRLFSTALSGTAWEMFEKPFFF